MARAKANFLKSVIDKLRMRVSNRCSNPACRVPTTGPSDDAEDKVNIIGIAAHICAASPGGPRYSQEMSDEERRSINNAIWLCSNCSIEIDKDENKYTVSALNQWKAAAESMATKELGKILPSESDAIDTVSAALTGYPKNFLAKAISNVHKASEQSLEKLDSRFIVKSAHSENGTNFGIFAKKDVRVSMNVHREYAEEYIGKYERLIAHGEDLTIDAGAITFDGSKLLEEISDISKEGEIIISSKKKKGVQKLWLVNKETGLTETFDDAQGEVSLGNESLGFKGTACNGLFTFRYRKGINKNNTTMTFGIDYQVWDKHDVRYLPYLPRILSLFKKMAEGWELCTALEIDGLRILYSEGMDASKLLFVTETNSILQYIDNVSIIANYLGESVPFNSNISYTNEDFKRVLDESVIIRGKTDYTENEITSSISCQLIVDEKAKIIESLSNMSGPTSIKYIDKSNTSIECFGRTLELPAKSVSIDQVTPNIVSPQSSYKKGDIVQVEWIPADNFKCKIEYVKDTA